MEKMSFVFFCLVLLLLQQPAFSQDFGRGVVGAAAASVKSSDGYQTTGVIGQPIIGVIHSASDTSRVGFWYAASSDLLIPVFVESSGDEIPEIYTLGPNYPNPFSRVTTIAFELSHSSSVTLSIYDVLGREVAIIVPENLSAGHHQAVWDAEDYSSGVYIYQLKTGTTTQSKTLIVQK